MSDDSALHAWHLTIHGRVQGVGFREAMRELALALNVVGWVRNHAEGHVEAHVQGEARSIERMVLWAQRGPPGAYVRKVDAVESALDPALITFARQPTM